MERKPEAPPGRGEPKGREVRQKHTASPPPRLVLARVVVAKYYNSTTRVVVVLAIRTTLVLLYYSRVCILLASSTDCSCSMHTTLESIVLRTEEGKKRN